jgi:hypothetical protein
VEGPMVPAPQKYKINNRCETYLFDPSILLANITYYTRNLNALRALIGDSKGIT